MGVFDRVLGSVASLTALLQRVRLTGVVLDQASIVDAIVNPTFGATVVVNVGLGTWQRVTQSSNAAHAIAAPTDAAGVASLVPGSPLTFTFRNTSGGAAGATTFNAVYKLQGGAWTSAATGNSRSITFLCDGTNYIELYRSAADVPN